MTNRATTESINSDRVFLRPALSKDISNLEALINRCYLFEEGWTNEAALVGGIRTNQNEIQAVIEDDNQHLFVYPQTDQNDKEETGALLGCINVAMHDDGAYIGFFAVSPDLQGSGVGSVILEKAEILAQGYLTKQQALEKSVDIKPIKMLVLYGRDKMLAYYQRRGYVCTGNTQSFSNHDQDDELHFTEIAKVINENNA